MFEQDTIQYLNGLVSSGIFISGNITGINELQENAEALISIMINSEVKEKKIKIYKQTGDYNWAYLSPIVDNDMEYTTDDWSYPSYSKRIIAPISLVMYDDGIKMYGWFQLNNLPVINKNNIIYLYCNVILEEHQSVVDQFEGIITIENRP